MPGGCFRRGRFAPCWPAHHLNVDRVASFTNPILVDSNGGIIAGHGRVMEAKELRLEAVPCIVLAHLTPLQRKAYVIADNKPASMPKTRSERTSPHRSGWRSWTRSSAIGSAMTSNQGRQISLTLPNAR